MVYAKRHGRLYFVDANHVATLSEADTTNFEVVSYEFARSSSHIFCEETAHPYPSPEDLRSVGPGLACTNDVLLLAGHYVDSSVELQDLGHLGGPYFRYASQICCFKKEKNSYQYSVLTADPESFEVLGLTLGRDKSGVYNEERKVSVDASSVEFVSTHFIKDANEVYFLKWGDEHDPLELVPLKSDPRSFEVLNDRYARDNAQAFYYCGGDSFVQPMYMAPGCRQVETSELSRFTPLIPPLLDDGPDLWPDAFDHTFLYYRGRRLPHKKSDYAVHAVEPEGFALMYINMDLLCSWVFENARDLFASSWEVSDSTCLGTVHPKWWETPGHGRLLRLSTDGPLASQSSPLLASPALPPSSEPRGDYMGGLYAKRHDTMFFVAGASRNYGFPSAIKGVDLASFRVLKPSIAEDDQQGYNRDDAITPGSEEILGKDFLNPVDIESLEHIAGPYLQDRDTIFCYWYSYDDMSDDVVDADRESFEVLGHGFARDKDKVFNHGAMDPRLDPSTFVVIDSYFAKDKNDVYYLSWGGKESAQITVDGIGADPESFRQIDAHYARDATRLYFHFNCGSLARIRFLHIECILVPDVDPDTFLSVVAAQPSDRGNCFLDGFDGVNLYFHGRRIPLEPEDYTLSPRDGQSVTLDYINMDAVCAYVAAEGHRLFTSAWGFSATVETDPATLGSIEPREATPIESKPRLAESSEVAGEDDSDDIPF